MNRGDRREPILKDDKDRHTFINTLEQACQKTGWQVHAFCLMSHHFHLVVETPGGNLAAGMKWFLGTYTSRFNRRHPYDGHVFSGRYKALLVDKSGSGYLKTLCDYVHLNPVRAKLLQPEQSLKEYRWSSYREYLSSAEKRARWMRVDRVLGEMNIGIDNAAGRREFARRMEASRRNEVSGEYRKIRRGWFYGEETFRRELLLLASGKLGQHHYGSEGQETEEDKAQRLIAADLKRAGWKEAELEQRDKGDPIKLAVAGRLRAETTLPMKWICQRLRMGSWKYLNRKLYELRKRQ